MFVVLYKAWSGGLALCVKISWHICLTAVLFNMLWLGSLTLRVISRFDAAPCMYLGAGALVGIGEGILKEMRMACSSGRHCHESPIKYDFQHFYRSVRSSPYHSRIAGTVDMTPVQRRLFDAI
eukprot:jgi/Botrbrau1/8709/Bobra.0311s0021.1